jgi:hypothetical protein
MQKCPKHLLDLEVDVIVTGGCHGHSEDDRCYCDSPDVRVELYCPRPRCHHRVIVTALSDQYSMARWLKDKL